MPAGLLYEAPPHKVNIYLPAAPTFDDGGGTKLNWSATPDQPNCPCSINTSDARIVSRQGQDSITVGNRIGIWSEALTVTLVQGTKLITVDTGRTFILQGLASPNRPYGDYVTDMPALTYCTCDEIL